MNANTRAILAARQGRGFRSRWVIAGYGNGVRMIKPGGAQFQRTLGPSVRYPCRDRAGHEYQTGGETLDICRPALKAAVMNLISELSA